MMNFAHYQMDLFGEGARMTLGQLLLLVLSLGGLHEGPRQNSRLQVRKAKKNTIRMYGVRGMQVKETHFEYSKM